MNTDPRSSSPRVFLSYATENEPLAREIAEALMAGGADTFVAMWEMKAGDSIVARINEGLAGCTHFVVLLTPISITRPWVHAEMDAGFVLRVQGQCVFMALRHDVPASAMPPLLRPLHAPEIALVARDIGPVISDIHGVSRKPRVGPPPKAIAQATLGPLGLSPGAEAIARLIVTKSALGRGNDPHLAPDEIERETGLLRDAIVDGAHELEQRGYVRLANVIAGGRYPFRAVFATSRIFVELDGPIIGTDPIDDACRIAAGLMNGAHSGRAAEIAAANNWEPRRVNPAMALLEQEDAGLFSKEIHPTWGVVWMGKNDATRRFLSRYGR